MDLAVNEISKDRSSLILATSNREVYKLIKDGVKVELRSDGELITESIKVVDWINPANKDLLVASGFTVSETSTSTGLTPLYSSTAYQRSCLS